MKQFIYITGSTETNIYKIGLSANPEQRVKNINGSSNQKNDYQKIYEVHNMNLSEKSLHLKYKEQRLNGEWFKLNQEDLDWIEENAETFCHDAYKDKLNRKLKLRLSSAELDLLELIIEEIYPRREICNMFNALQLSQSLQQEYNTFKPFINKLYRLGIVCLIGDNKIMINPNVFKGHKPSMISMQIFQTFTNK